MELQLFMGGDLHRVVRHAIIRKFEQRVREGCRNRGEVHFPDEVWAIRFGVRLMPVESKWSL